MNYNVSESENVEPHSKSEVQRIDSNDLYVLTKTFSCLSISVPLPHRAEYGALLWLVRLHAVCHIDTHYCRNSDSLESMAEPITGGGTCITKKFLPPPLQPHELVMLDMVDKRLEFRTDSVPIPTLREKIAIGSVSLNRLILF